MIWQQVLKFKNIKLFKKKKKFVLPTVWKDIIKCDIIYYQKTLKYFKDLKNRHFWVLWLKWNQATEMIQNQTYIFLLKYIKVFQWLSKSEFVSFMTKMNPNNGNKTKSDIFPWDIFKSGIVFIGCKILKYFKDFYNWHFSISLQKWAQSSKVKLHGTCANLTVFFIYKAVLFLNDLWNLFLDKLYH